MSRTAGQSSGSIASIESCRAVISKARGISAHRRSFPRDPRPGDSSTSIGMTAKSRSLQVPSVRLFSSVVTAALTCAVCISVRAQETAVEPVVVAADRLPDSNSSAPFTVHEIDATELRRAPELRLDDVLRAEVPGFSLFRRNSSRTANPTTQGVTLRNFGPSGAGRTLVLLDGIPLNDPFAGYVLWSQIPPAALHSVVVVSGGGAGLFGNEALAGTIFLVSQPATENSAHAE